MATPKQEAYLDALRWAYSESDDAIRLSRSGVQSHEMNVRAASQSINALKRYAAASWPWQPLSKQSIVAEMAFQMQRERGRDRFSRRDFDALERRLSPCLQTEFLTFSQNGRGDRDYYGRGRVPLDKAAAVVKLRQVMSRVQSEVTDRLQRKDDSQGSQFEQQARQRAEQRAEQARKKADEFFDSSSQDSKSASDRIMERLAEQDRREREAMDERRDESMREFHESRSTGNDWNALYRRINQARKFAEERNLDSLYSMRVAIDARKAFNAGLPAETILASVTADWTDDTRRQFDGYRDEPTPQPNLYAKYGEAPAGVHAVGPYVEKLISANVPTYLHGPAGTGKSSAAKLAAERLGLDYYELNLAGAMASAIRGRDTMSGFVESVFLKAYRYGGVLALEEMDAAHPNVLTAINNAIANGHWFNEATGREVKRHPDFRIVGTGNTLGHGATKDFSGRNRLDGATLDRFRVGRVEVLHDPKLEAHILQGMDS